MVLGWFMPKGKACRIGSVINVSPEGMVIASWKVITTQKDATKYIISSPSNFTLSFIITIIAFVMEPCHPGMMVRYTL